MNYRMIGLLSCIGMMSVLLLTMASTGFASNGYHKAYAAAEFPTSDLTTKIRESINNQIREELSGSSVQDQGRHSPSPCTATSHRTVLTLNLFPTIVSAAVGGSITLTGTLTDTCTGSDVAGATITFTTTTPDVIIPTSVTDATGTYTTAFSLPPGFLDAGTFGTVQAHFAGQGIFEPSNSETLSYIVIP